MLTHKIISRFVLVAILALVSACATPPAATPVANAPTLGVPTSVQPIITPTPVPTAQAAATTGPTAAASASPVDFVWRYKGFVSNDTRLSRPRGLAFDAQDNLYVVDENSSRIQKLDRDGKLLLMWGSAGNGDGQFRFRFGSSHIDAIAVDAQGLVYVADYNGFVQIFDGQGKFLRKWGEGRGSGDGQLASPLCMAFDHQGNLLIAEGGDSIARIQKFDPQGNLLTKWDRVPDPSNLVTFCLAIDRQDNIYVVNRSQYRIEKYNSQGKLLATIGSKGDGEGQFAEPDSIAVDAQGNIYVTDNRYNFRVEKFDSNGKFLSQWGSWGDGDGQFKYVGRIAIDSQGNIYVSDDGFNDSIQKFRPR